MHEFIIQEAFNNRVKNMQWIAIIRSKDVQKQQILITLQFMMLLYLTYKK